MFKEGGVGPQNLGEIHPPKQVENPKNWRKKPEIGEKNPKIWEKILKIRLKNPKIGEKYPQKLEKKAPKL